MKLVAYRHEGHERLGVLDVERGLIFETRQQASAGPQSALLNLIESWHSSEKAAQQTIGTGLPAESVDLLAPLPQPARNIFCVGKNYRDHSAEFARGGFDTSHTGRDDSADIPAVPIFFTKPPSSVVGPAAPIDPHSDVTNALDYETELAVIIGRGGRGITPEQAWNHVWGYTILNDVTARDLQRDHKQWFLGKSLDTFCPMGPWAVTTDEIDATDLTVQCWVNEELRQQANTQDLIFDIPTLITTLSAGLSLQTGDVIATGTPAGVGLGYNPPRFLRPGDNVTMKISGLGTLTTPVLR